MSYETHHVGLIYWCSITVCYNSSSSRLHIPLPSKVSIQRTNAFGLGRARKEEIHRVEKQARLMGFSATSIDLKARALVNSPVCLLKSWCDFDEIISTLAITFKLLLNSRTIKLFQILLVWTHVMCEMNHNTLFLRVTELQLWRGQSRQKEDSALCALAR